MEHTSIEQLISLLPILFSIWITITVGVYTIRRHRVIGALSFAIVLFLEAIWTTGNLLEIISTNLEWKVFWENVQWLPSLLIPLFFLSFTYKYSKKDFANPIKMWAILSIIPFITLALIFRIRCMGGRSFRVKLSLNIYYLSISTLMEYPFG